MTYVGGRLASIDADVVSINSDVDTTTSSRASTTLVNTVNSNVTALGSSTRLGSIAGIDRGTITPSASGGATATATIGAVTVARTSVTFSFANGYGQEGVSDDAAASVSARGTLTNTTTITATAGQYLASNPAVVVTLGYEAVEYNA